MYYKEIKTGPVIHIAISMWVFKQIQLYLDHVGCWYRVSDLDFGRWKNGLIHFWEKNFMIKMLLCLKQYVKNRLCRKWRMKFSMEIMLSKIYREVTAKEIL
ncbi:hypothetical protein C823_002486 [Eubacterium plexicaudatum ASF492]|nr:hypothetical protein C823_002486 [Eubacterium plexicaudatum ASF492]